MVKGLDDDGSEGLDSSGYKGLDMDGGGLTWFMMAEGLDL